MQNQLNIRSQGAVLALIQNRVDLDNDLVGSESHDGAWYRTTARSCSCPDATYRKVVCKHQIAYRLASVLRSADLANESTIKLGAA